MGFSKMKQVGLGLVVLNLGILHAGWAQNAPSMPVPPPALVNTPSVQTTPVVPKSAESPAALSASVAPDAPPPLPPAASGPARIYIPVGDPTISKIMLAIDKTGGGGTLSQSFEDTLRSDMDFTDLFEIPKAGQLPTVTTTAGGSVDLDPFKAKNMEFLIRSSVTTTRGGIVEAELHLFDVRKGTDILARRYPFVSKQGQAARELAHSAANDIVKVLTTEDGIFRTRLLMSCGLRTKEIFIMDFDGQNVRQLTRDRNFALSPSWAPDGRKILFTSYKSGTAGGPLNPNLYMYDLTTNQRRLLSGAKGLNTGGAFHPKEQKIAYTFSVKARPEIYILDLVSNTRKAITSTQFFSVEPSWSPDGTRLTYSSSQTGRPHIFVANADGSSPKRLTFAGVYNSSPNWSPRGDKIVFSGQENMANNFNIFTIDPSGSNLMRLTDGSHSSENPVFSPDGRYLAFSSNAEGNYRIYVMTARGNRIRALSPTNLGHCKQPSWSPRL